MSEQKKCRKCGRKLDSQGKCVFCEIDKLMKTEEWRKFNSLMKKVEIKGVSSPLSKIEEGELLRTGTVLDDLLNGGIRRGQLTEFYGEYASGKTQTVETLVVECKGKIVYIDSEKTFSPSRVKQIATARGKDVDELNKRIFYFQPKNWKEQVAILHQINAKDVDLIVFDSLLAHFRSSKEFLGRQNLTNRQGIIRTHLADMRTVAQKYGCMVVFTNQVYDVPDAKPFTPFYKTQVGVGGHTVYHIPDIRIFFRKAKDPKRIARLMDSSELPPMEVVFQINEKGIDDLPKEEK